MSLLRLDQFSKVYLHLARVDFRKSIDGLSRIVQDEMGHSPFSLHSLFVFVNKNRSRVKILYWDETGFALWMKRLEKARFPWPKTATVMPTTTTTTERAEPVLSVTAQELEWLLGGYEFWKLKPHEKLEFTCVS